MRGLRPMRTGTVAQALLRAVAGQLILAKRARQIERSIIRAASPELGGMHAAPTCAELGAFSPAQLARHGLGARRAAALIRLCRSRELESLKSLPVAAVAARLNRERGLGPWSVGVICLEGLGRYEFGLARDLGLVKLASALWGRWVEAEETDELLRALRGVGRPGERLPPRRASTVVSYPCPMPDSSPELHVLAAPGARRRGDPRRAGTARRLDRAHGRLERGRAPTAKRRRSSRTGAR